MKYFFLLALTFTFSISFGQTDTIEIETIERDSSFFFPIIYSENSSVEYKINTHLQLSELELLKGHEKKDIFEQVVAQDDSEYSGTFYGAKETIHFDVLRNSSNILSIEFWQFSCGVTCATWVKYYNFNPQNGDRYFLNDFFGTENFEKFRKILSVKRTARLRKEVQMKGMGKKEDHFLGYILPAIENGQLKDFYFSKDSIYVDNENLLRRHDKNTDIDHITAFSISDTEPLLNNLGKSALITFENLAFQFSSTEPQLYTGQIDSQYDVVFLFKPSYGNNYGGIYACLEYGIGIDLEGEFNNGTYELKENSKNFEEIGTIRFEKQGDMLNGTWTSKDKQKAMTFLVTRQ